MSRRLLVTVLSAASLLFAFAAGADEASHHAPPPDKEKDKAAQTPDEVLAFLRAGNARFKGGTSVHLHQGSKRLGETAPGEHPVATVLSCSDSRVPPEVLFDEGIGDIFSIRVAGNVVDAAEMGSAEYGVDTLGTPLLVVMGHTKCSAVTAVATHATVHGHIPALLELITGAVEATRTKYPSATDTDLIPEATRENVFQSIATLLRESEAVRARVESGKAHVVGAIYDIESGHVEWLGRHEDEASILAEANKAAASHGGARHGAGTHGASAHGAPSHGKPTASASAHAAPADAHAAAASTAPAPEPPAPSMPPPLSFVLVAVLCTVGGTISGRLSAPKA